MDNEFQFLFYDNISPKIVLGWLLFLTLETIQRDFLRYTSPRHAPSAGSGKVRYFSAIGNKKTWQEFLPGLVPKKGELRVCRVMLNFEPAFAGGFLPRNVALAQAYRVISVSSKPFLMVLAQNLSCTITNTAEPTSLYYKPIGV